MVLLSRLWSGNFTLRGRPGADLIDPEDKARGVDLVFKALAKHLHAAERLLLIVGTVTQGAEPPPDHASDGRYADLRRVLIGATVEERCENLDVPSPFHSSKKLETSARKNSLSSLAVATAGKGLPVRVVLSIEAPFALGNEKFENPLHVFVIL